MYLYGRRLGAKNYFLRWAEIEKLVPDLYKVYQKRRVDALWVAPKLLAYDEMHYASACPAVIKQIESDLRVGRKYNLVTLMCSQRIDDFPPECVSNCYNFFIFGAGDSAELSKIQSVFSLSDAEKDAIHSHCHGNGKFFYKGRMNDGDVSQALFGEAGPVMRWAFNTSPVDAPLRDEVARTLGSAVAAERLAACFPSGSIRSQAEAYSRRMASTQGSVDPLAVQRHFVDKVLNFDPAG
jgi:intracellular multiplication protein IcmB